MPAARIACSGVLVLAQRNVYRLQCNCETDRFCPFLCPLGPALLVSNFRPCSNVYRGHCLTAPTPTPRTIDARSEGNIKRASLRRVCPFCTNISYLSGFEHFWSVVHYSSVGIGLCWPKRSTTPFWRFTSGQIYCITLHIALPSLFGRGQYNGITRNKHRERSSGHFGVSAALVVFMTACLHAVSIYLIYFPLDALIFYHTL
jgi:hypothetical protein